MKILFIINEAPYGGEKAYNALRMANQMGKDYPKAEVFIFLMADAVACAAKNQSTPNGYYNIERMLAFSLAKGAMVGICGSCAQARGLGKEMLAEGCELSNMPLVTQWTMECDKVLVF